MKKESASPGIALLMTGNELVTGELADTNSVFMARMLAEAGIVVSRMVTVGDEFTVLTTTLDALSREYDIVIINGGMGSTVDDLSAEAAASVSRSPLVERPEAIKHITDKIGKEFMSKDSRYFTQMRKQARMPQSADVLDNSVGLALGFKLRINRATCYFTPGVPREMREMFTSSILPEVLDTYKLSAGHRTVRMNIVGIGESQVQQLINRNIPEKMLENIDLGFRAKMSYVELKLTIHDSAHESLLASVQEQARSILSDNVFSDGQTMPEILVDELRGRKLRLALAESCTGGLIASEITAVPGASDVFDAGLVTYSNQSKSRLLGVTQELLDQFGAVSSQVAEAMVEGALTSTGATTAVAVTGIAGPTGGTEEKPVGTVYIGWGSSGNVQTRLMQVNRERTIFQQLVCSAALDILRRYIQGLDTDSIYYFDDISRQRLRSEG